MSEIIVKMKDYLKIKGATYVRDLVRCKNCKYFDKDLENKYGVCSHPKWTESVNIEVDREDYCSHGEER